MDLQTPAENASIKAHNQGEGDQNENKNEPQGEEEENHSLEPETAAVEQTDPAGWTQVNVTTPQQDNKAMTVHTLPPAKSSLQISWEVPETGHRLLRLRLEQELANTEGGPCKLRVRKVYQCLVSNFPKCVSSETVRKMLFPNLVWALLRSMPFQDIVHGLAEVLMTPSGLPTVDATEGLDLDWETQDYGLAKFEELMLTGNRNPEARIAVMRRTAPTRKWNRQQGLHAITELILSVQKELRQQERHALVPLGTDRPVTIPYLIEGIL